MRGCIAALPAEKQREIAQAVDFARMHVRELREIVQEVKVVALLGFEPRLNGF